MQATPEVILGTTIGLIAALIWAITVNVYKSQSSAIKPVGITALKMWLAFIFMAVVILSPLRTGPFSVPLESVFYLGGSILLGASIGDVIYLSSQQRIGVCYAYPISNIYPITTYLLAIPLLGEIPSMVRFAGVVVGVVGVVIISYERHAKNDETHKRLDFVGVGLALLSALLSSIATICLQIGSSGINPIDANFVRVTIGSLFFLPVFAIAKSRGLKTPKTATIKILIAGFFGMALGSLMYVYVVQLVGAATASLLGSTSTLFAVPISVIFLKERITARTLLGIMVAVIGVMVVVSTT